MLGTTSAIHQTVTGCVQGMGQQEESGPIATKKHCAADYQSTSKQGDETEGNCLNLAGKRLRAGMSEFAVLSFLDSRCITGVALFMSGLTSPS